MSKQQDIKEGRMVTLIGHSHQWLVEQIKTKNCGAQVTLLRDLGDRFIRLTVPSSLLRPAPASVHLLDRAHDSSPHGWVHKWTWGPGLGVAPGMTPGELSKARSRAQADQGDAAPDKPRSAERTRSAAEAAKERAEAGKGDATPCESHKTADPVTPEEVRSTVEQAKAYVAEYAEAAIRTAALAERICQSADWRPRIGDPVVIKGCRQLWNVAETCGELVTVLRDGPNGVERQTVHRRLLRDGVPLLRESCPPPPVPEDWTPRRGDAVLLRNDGRTVWTVHFVTGDSVSLVRDGGDGSLQHATLYRQALRPVLGKGDVGPVTDGDQTQRSDEQILTRWLEIGKEAEYDLARAIADEETAVERAIDDKFGATASPESPARAAPVGDEQPVVHADIETDAGVPSGDMKARRTVTMTTTFEISDGDKTDAAEPRRQVGQLFRARPGGSEWVFVYRTEAGGWRRDRVVGHYEWPIALSGRWCRCRQLPSGGWQVLEVGGKWAPPTWDAGLAPPVDFCHFINTSSGVDHYRVLGGGEGVAPVDITFDGRQATICDGWAGPFHPPLMVIDVVADAGAPAGGETSQQWPREVLGQAHWRRQAGVYPRGPELTWLDEDGTARTARLLSVIKPWDSGRWCQAAVESNGEARVLRWGGVWPVPLVWFGPDRLVIGLQHFIRTKDGVDRYRLDTGHDGVDVGVDILYDGKHVRMENTATKQPLTEPPTGVLVPEATQTDAAEQPRQEVVVGQSSEGDVWTVWERDHETGLESCQFRGVADAAMRAMRRLADRGADCWAVSPTGFEKRHERRGPGRWLMPLNVRASDFIRTLVDPGDPQSGRPDRLIDHYITPSGDHICFDNSYVTRGRPNPHWPPYKPVRLAHSETRRPAEDVTWTAWVDTWAGKLRLLNGGTAEVELPQSKGATMSRTAKFPLSREQQAAMPRGVTECWALFGGEPGREPVVVVKVGGLFKPPAGLHIRDYLRSEQHGERWADIYRVPAFPSSELHYYPQEQ